MPGSTDQIDVNMKVEEKPTGNITVGAGFSQSEKLALTGAISQENAFGSGNTVSLSVNTAHSYRTIALSETNPYFTDDGISRTYDIYLRTVPNSVYSPGDYRYQRANLEVSTIGSLRYFRTTYQNQYFQPFWGNTSTLALNGEIDYGHGLDGKPYPIFKNFYAGGIGSVRGYEDSSLGNLKDQYGDSLGGASRVVGSMELQFPFSGAGQDRTMRWFLFLDGGQVYADGSPIQAGQLRYSTGIGISWLSPIGPLKFSYGHPLNSKPGDKSQPLQFQLGTGF